MSGYKGVCNFKITWFCFNPYFLIFSSFVKMPKKAKSKSINILQKKWKQWYK